MAAVQEGIPCCSVYGAMDQTARKINVGRFRAGKVQFMLVTDVAARGIDIPLIDNVINYDFTPKPKLFVHRSGRAARAGRPGTSVSFVTADEYPYLIDLHLFLSRPLRVVGQPLPQGAAQALADEGDSWCVPAPGVWLRLVVCVCDSWCVAAPQARVCRLHGSVCALALVAVGAPEPRLRMPMIEPSP